LFENLSVSFELLGGHKFQIPQNETDDPYPELSESSMPEIRFNILFQSTRK